jgi:methanol metabolism-related c-type cytochrome
MLRIPRSDLDLYVKTSSCLARATVATMLILSVTLCLADGSDDPTPIKNDDGKYYDKDGNPTFKIAADGTVDWYTYSGYRRYNAECEVCHGPDGEGSTFAPSLIDSLKTMNYSEFVNVIVNGRKNVDAANDKVMPSFGTNPNVMCYLDDIFVYLRARSERKLGRGRPSKHEDKPDSAKKSKNACVEL